MNEEIIENDVLEDATLNEDNVSSVESTSLEEQLDRIEALLNEDITLRENSSEVDVDEEDGTVDHEPVLRTESGSTASGVEPNYAQYIYDYLSDSTIRVEVVQTDTLETKQLQDYSPSEALICVILIVVLANLLFGFVEKYVFKIKR